MKPIQLDEIIPSEAHITLTVLGDSRVFKLRPINLDDEVWLNETFGDTLQSIFSKSKFQEICKIVFHQMDEADKVLFAARDIPYTDVDGEKKTVRRGGAALLQACVKGPAEKQEIMYALLKTLGISRPLVDKLAQTVESDQKKSQPQTGPQSLISSEVNTDGALEKLGS